jgi:hypothetical protein
MGLCPKLLVVVVTGFAERLVEGPGEGLVEGLGKSPGRRSSSKVLARRAGSRYRERGSWRKFSHIRRIATRISPLALLPDTVPGTPEHYS